MAEAERERLRPHPSERFAGREDHFDLNEAIEYLRSEPSGQHGHKQLSLFRHGPATLALFLFDAGSELKDHVVDGPVVLHVLAGSITVRTEDDSFEVGADQVLRLSPSVAHHITARAGAQVLMTLCVEGPNSHA